MSDAPALLRRPRSDDGFATRSEVEALRRRVALLEERLADMPQKSARAFSSADREWLMHLLPAIDAAVGDRVWALPDLAALALLPDNAALAAALSARTGRTTLQRLGKALARCAGHDVGGFELRRVGTSRGGVLWQVVRG